MSVQDLLRQHGCYMSDHDEKEIEALRFTIEFDELGRPLADAADLAIRTCMCGESIDGFDEYHGHLVKVFEQAGYEK